MVEKAGFTLTAERGCAEGQLTMLSQLVPGGNPQRMNPFLLAHGDVVEMVPELGAAAWYLGYVRTRSRDLTGRHVYSLYGLAGKLTDLPVTTNISNPQYFGTAVTAGFYPGASVYLPSHPSAGLVQWLASVSVQDGEGNFVSGPVYVAMTGILPPDSWAAECTGMSAAASEQIELMQLDSEAKVGTVLEEQARSIRDLVVANAANPRPVIWGVGPDRKIYFRFRPESEVMTLDIVRGETAARLTIGGAAVALTGGQPTEEEGEDFRNVLFVRGGTDDAASGVGDGSDQVIYTYFNTASIAHYKQRRSDTQEMPSLRCYADAARFAACYFQRYATIQNSYTVPPLAITSATGLPLPWAGYCQVTTDTIAGIPGKHTINSVTVEFNETPTAGIQLCSSTPGAFTSSGSGVRWPGNMFKACNDRIPRVNVRQGGGGSSAISIGAGGLLGASFE